MTGENKKNAVAKALVFLANLFLMGLAFFAIKESDKKNSETQTDISETLTPLSQKVVDAQSAIATDRENKLRDLNTAPKVVGQQQVTTKTTTTTPSSGDSSSSSSKKSSTKTKTS